MHFKLLSICLLFSCLLLTGCTQQSTSTPIAATNSTPTPTTEATQKPVLVVTTYFLEDFAKQVAGSDAMVVNLLPDGTNPHSYEPSPKDLELINSADAFVFNGAGLEPYAARVAKTLPTSVQVVEASAGLVLVEATDKDHGNYDPHVWLDPLLAKKEVTAIQNALIAVDPKNAEDYQARALAYFSQLVL
jgi:zinc transport system substrate-binding protein